MQKIIQKNFLSTLLIMLILVISFSSISAAGSKYSYVLGGSSDFYFTTNDGKLFTNDDKDKLVQFTALKNVKMAADDIYFGLWVLEKSGDVYHYDLNYDDKVVKCQNKKKVANLSKVNTISVGSESIFALKTDGTVWSVDNNLKTSQVKGLSNVTNISVRDFDLIALKKDGTVWQYRDEAIISDYIKKSPLTQIVELKNVKEISACAECGLALLKDNTVWQWSFDSYKTKKPVKITGIATPKSISGGRMEGYVLDTKGEVWTWNNYGGKTEKPTKVKGLSGIVRIATSGKDGYDGFSLTSLAALDKNDKIKYVKKEM